MEESKLTIEEQATKTVKNLAKGVLVFALLQLLGGLAFLLFADFPIEDLLPALLVLPPGIATFILGWFLFKKQSYFASVLLTVFIGGFCILMFLGIALSIIMLLWLVLSIPFFLLSYRGMKAAAVIKKIRAKKISPEVFS